MALGERGPVWWTDGAADLNRVFVNNTPYAAWLERLESEQDKPKPKDLQSRVPSADAQ